jgi:hypothetical protein
LHDGERESPMRHERHSPAPRTMVEHQCLVISMRNGADCELARDATARSRFLHLTHGSERGSLRNHVAVRRTMQ